MKKIRILFLCSFLCSCASSINPPQVIDSVDPARYAGCWYEIATIPMFVQRGCVGTTATYRQQDNGSLRVVNKCYSETLEGSVRQVEGDAVPVSAGNFTKLKISFDTWWGIFARGDYWIVLLDPHYQYSVVSGPKRNRLWILSREPVMAAETYQSIRNTLEQRGFDLTGLEMTKQFPERNLCELNPQS